MHMLVVLFAFSFPFAAQENAEPSVVAKVGEHEISKVRVQRHVKKTLGQLDVPDSAKPILMSEALQHLIRRHQVLQSIKQTGVKVGDAEIRIESEKLNDRLVEIDSSLEAYLKSIKLNRSELEYEYYWRLAWQKYLDI